MWFKQLSVFSFAERFNLTNEQIEEKLKALAFHDCLPSLPESHGWVSPIPNSTALVASLNDCYLFCMNSEEKILPGIVISQQLSKKITEREVECQKKIYSKEKMQMKEDLILELLPKAFSKHSKTYLYVDKKQQWLVIGTTQLRRVEKILYLFKKSFNIDTFPLFENQKVFDFKPFIHKDALEFQVEPSYVLQDPQNINREIRCKQQDIYDEPLQSLLKEYQIKQLALNWQNRISFQLKQNGDLQSLRYGDELIQESKDSDDATLETQFNADFLIMSTSIRQLVLDLLDVSDQKKSIAKNPVTQGEYLAQA